MHLSMLVSREGGGGVGQAKAGDLTKEVGPWWGLLIITKSQGGDL